MESYANVFDEEWVNLGSIFFCDQDSNHFTGHGLFSSEHDHHGLNLETPVFLPSANESISSSSCIIDGQILANTSDHDIKSNLYNCFSQESSNASDSPPYPCNNIFQFCPSNTPADNVSDQSKDLCMMEGDSTNFLFLAQVFSDDAMEEVHCLKQDEVVERGKMENSLAQPADLGKITHLKRKHETLELPTELEEGNTGKFDKKKTRVSNDNKNKKNLPPKKIQKMMTSINRNDYDSEETHYNKEKITNKNNGRGNVQISSSSCSSEEDSNASQELKGTEIVARAGRGAATDPQSIYARKRRERINERLRILQTLVPNGTKVDISTMLEEAVHYVKFLQLQINLLSSDDKWMYAPIAYNGVDMGLYNNISPTL